MQSMSSAQTPFTYYMLLTSACFGPVLSRGGNHRQDGCARLFNFSQTGRRSWGLRNRGIPTPDTSLNLMQTPCVTDAFVQAATAKPQLNMSQGIRTHRLCSGAKAAQLNVDVCGTYICTGQLLTAAPWHSLQEQPSKLCRD